MAKVIISDKSISKYKPTDSRYFVKVADCPCLFLRIEPSGVRTWYYNFKQEKQDGKKYDTKLAIGSYPSISLVQAKEIWAQWHTLRKGGTDLQQHLAEQKAQAQRARANTFAAVSEQWAQVQQWADNTRKRRNVRLSLLWGYFGDKPMNDISTDEILRALNDIQSKYRQRNNPDAPSDTAERCKGMLLEIFAWAKLNSLCDHNPTAAIKEAKSEYSTQKVRYNNRPALTKPLEFGAMLAKIQKANIAPATYHLLMLLAYTCVRIGDIRTMRWADVDLDAGVWELVPIKGQSKSKIKMVEAMRVPLSRQAIAILRAQQRLTGQYAQVFYSDNTNGIINENTAGKALNRLGYQNKHCPHGFRSSGKSLLMQELDYNHIITEMVLGHLVNTGNKREDPYLRADLYEQRTELMQRWADYCDDLAQGLDTAKYKGIYRRPPAEIVAALVTMIGKDEILKLLG